jgi:hypothetical protein
MALGPPDPNLIQALGTKPSAPDFRSFLEFAGDDAYPTGGTAEFAAYVCTALSREFCKVQYVLDGAHSSTDHTVVYDNANDKLKVILRSTGAEIADTTNLSGITFRVWVGHD